VSPTPPSPHSSFPFPTSAHLLPSGGWPHLLPPGGWLRPCAASSRVAEPILYPNPNSSLKKIFTIPVSPFLPLSLTWLMPLPPMQDYPCLTERPDKSRRRAVRREGRRRAGAWLWRPRGDRRGRLAPALVLHPAQLRRSRTAPVPPHHRTHQLPREISSSSPQVIHSASLRSLPGKNHATSTVNPPAATPTVSFFSLSCLYLIL
jgi:hypothetical protein